MTKINTNVASLRGLRALNRTNKQLNTSLTRLTTGLKINSGADNPAGLIASETLGSQIASIEQSIKNSNRAGNVLATADAALSEIGGLLTQVRGLIQEALNDGALSQDEIEANQLQIDAALSAINRISSNTTFGGDRLIDGSKAFTAQLTSADSAELTDYQINEATFGTNSTIQVTAKVAQAAQKGTLLYNAGAPTSAATVEVGGAKGNEVLFFGNAATLDDIATAINNVSDSTGVEAAVTTASVEGTLTANVTQTSGSFAVNGGAEDLVITRNAGQTDVVTVAFADAGAGGATTASVAGLGTGNATLTLSYDYAAGTATIDDVIAAIQADADSNTLVTGSVGSVGGGGTTAFTGAETGGALAASAVEAFEFTEQRATSDTISIAFADAGSGENTSVAVTGVGTGAATITVSYDHAAGNVTMQNIIDAIQNDAEASSLVAVEVGSVGGGANTVLADLPTGGTVDTGKQIGQVTLTSSGYGENQFVELNVLSGSFSAVDSDGNTTSRDAGSDVVASINGQQAQTNGLRATIKTSSLDATLTFTESAGTTVGTTTTLNITGGGATFQIGQEVSSAGQIGIGIEAVNTARLGGTAGKLYELGSTGGKSLLDVSPSNPGSTLVDIVEQAINRVSTLRGRLGAIQKNVIETNINSLGVALENISESRSQLIDTDFAEETASLTRAQILQQAGFQALSLANNNPQAVLNLLG